MNKVGGYLRSSGNLNVPEFAISNTVKQLGSANQSSEYHIPDNVPILNQKSLSSCAANACCEAFSILQANKGLFTDLLSRLFVYYNARSYVGETNVDNGSYIHLAFDSMAKMGICRESVWPYVEQEVFAQPPILAYKEGTDNTINSFYQIIDRGEDLLDKVEAALRANHPVVFGTEVSAEFRDYMNGDPNKVFDAPLNSIGKHALLISGVRRGQFNEREWLIRNSWSSAWGIGGRCWFSSSYLKDPRTADFFVATNMDNLLV